MSKLKGISLDKYIAKKFLTKVNNANSEGINFTLTLFQFKKILSRDKCFYTDVIMNKVMGESNNWNDLTLDRIDNNIGYVYGNVVACTRAANNLKGIWENPTFDITVENARDIATKTIAMLKKLNNKEK